MTKRVPRGQISPSTYLIRYASFYLVHSQFPQIGSVTKKGLPRLTHHYNIVTKVQIYEKTVKSLRYNSDVKVKYLCIT